MPVTVVPGLNVRLICCGGGVNDAVTDCAEFMVTAQVVVPEQAPPHPANVVLPLGVAVSVTGVPAV